MPSHEYSAKAIVTTSLLRHKASAAGTFTATTNVAPVDIYQ